MKRNLTSWILGAAVATALVVGGVLALTGQNQHSSSQKTTPNSTHGQASHEVTITYTDNGFSPDSYMVKTGGTVTVVNKSSHDLEFSSGPHPTHTAEPELNMDVLHAGKSGTFTVTKLGTWGFHNHLNEQDTGSLMVM